MHGYPKTICPKVTTLLLPAVCGSCFRKKSSSSFLKTIKICSNVCINYFNQYKLFAIRALMGSNLQKENFIVINQLDVITIQKYSIKAK